MSGLALAGACGDNDLNARIVFDLNDEAPAYGRSPFPTDALIEGRNIGPIAGLERMAKQHFDLIGAHLSTLDGWGLRPTVQFFIEGELDRDTIPEDVTRSLADALIVLDVDPDTAEDGAALPSECR